MKSLSEFILEEESEEYVYSVYYDDGTLYNVYNTEEEANDEAKKLSKENTDFPATVKKEKKSSFEQ